jgi:hypothetical protein
MRLLILLVVFVSMTSCNQRKKDCTCETDNYSIEVWTKVPSEIQGSSANRSTITFYGNGKQVVVAEYNTYGVNKLNLNCDSDTIRIIPKDLQTLGILGRAEILSMVEGVYIAVVDLQK